MKAILLYQRKRQFLTKSGRAVVIHMDLFEIPGKAKESFPGGYKFSWIAFDANDSEKQILFDSHPPKGPHFHIDQEKDGVSFVWTSIDDSEALFFKMVTDKFGEFT